MPIDPLTLLALVLLGGLVGIDAVSCPQVMISRPIVASTFAGIIMGDAQAGLAVGLGLELLTLRQLPVGAARNWDPGPAAVAATVALNVAWSRFGAHGGSYVTSYALALSVGVIVAWIGGRSVLLQRRLNEQIVAGSAEHSIKPSDHEARHVSAIGLDFVRSTGLTAVAVFAAAWLGEWWPELSGTTERSAALLLIVVLSLALGGALGTIERGRRVASAFGVGTALSAILWLWLR